ncbi:F-box domain-containing protein [Sarocladium implicatum]|nr:F-box domain-containing protein [Sarocladium implicatum]
MSESDNRRSSIDKAPLQSDAFQRLPDEIIQQILKASDPNAFASLVLLNQKWRAVAQQPHLYAHQLSQCPSFALSHATLPPPDDANLPRLRALFAQQVKRNLFDAYLRPSETIIKLVSNSISSSSCPGGEGMLFSASPKGHHLLAYNSSRIHVIDVRGSSPRVKRELKILRRPASTCINDEGTVLAILSSEMRVDVYDMEHTPPKQRQSIILDNSPRTIAMSPGGSVLAAAYEGGIEVSSLNPTALASERRSVKCDGVDALSFSFDGTQILGTTTQSQPPSTVILTAPYYDPGSQMMSNDEGAMWTTSILFPNTSRDCSHAVLLQDGSHEEAAWTFTYDRAFETFRAVRIDDLRNGTTYFTGPLPDSDSQATLLPSTLPAATYRGDLVSAGFQGRDIWIYGVPEDLDAPPDTVSSSTENSSLASGLGRRESNRSNLSRNASSRGRDGVDGRLPQWQVMCDKGRNCFIAGVKVSDVAEARNVKWVANFGEHSLQERLVVTAKGVSSQPRLVTEEEDFDFVDGGRLTLLDFDYSLRDGDRTEITIELGSDNAEVLEEEQRSLETEVAIVRRRTVARNRGNRASLLRAATTSARHLDVPQPPMPTEEDEDPLLPRRIRRLPAQRQQSDNSEEDGEFASIEEQEALDAPYAHASPRSVTTLRRAATAAAADRTRNPRTADGRPIEYQRADGRREHPHESDADNWVPPPPPYQKEDPGATPAFLSGPSVAPLGAPPVPVPPIGQHPLARHAEARDESDTKERAQETVPDSVVAPPVPAVLPPQQQSQEHQQASVVQEDDNLYDVSPPESPRMEAVGRVNSDPASSSPARPDTARTASHASTGAPQLVTPPRQAGGLNLDIPSPSSWETQPSGVSASPSERRLPNAQTWPGGPQAPSSLSVAGPTSFPVSAPADGSASIDFASALPPTASQMQSLNRRISQGNPRRLSGGLHVQRVPVGGRTAENQPRRPATEQSFYPPTDGRSGTWPLEDQPLIISTPRGVTGAFDPQPVPAHFPPTNPRDEPPLIAPVARHPRAVPGTRNRPTVERLETIYSIAQDNSVPATAPPGRAPRWFQPRSRRPERAGSQRSSRSQSRAERSAAKNMEDARKKAWDAKMKKNEKSRKKKQKSASEMASTAWTDVTMRSETAKEKDKKCTVM